ncbi:hypothetical protein AGR9A_Cc210060 [Agrobacterium salinitolerans str. Hayward 0363]|nr:hypothetical protein AGR9A_Cc210060 [Agrobacterium salinitolerans str. Hayward 0363]
MRFSLQGIRRAAVTRIIIGRVHDDVMEIIIGQSGRDTRFRTQRHIRLAHIHPRGKRGILGQFEAAASKLNHFRRALIERHLRLFEPCRNRHAGSARTCAEIGDPAGAVIRHQRGQKHGVHAGPVPPALRLDDVKPAPVKGVDRFGNAIAHRRSSLFVAQLVAEPGIDENAAGLIGAVVFHQEPSRQKAERPLQNAHRLIGDEAMDAGIPHQAFGEGEQHGVIGSDQFTHG